MKIELWGFDVSSAIMQYLSDKYGMDDECYIEDMYIERNEDDIMETFNLHQYKKDQEWDQDKGWVVHNEYELEGIYLKRKKKGGKKFQYVKLDEDDCRDASMNPDQGNMILWLLDSEGC
tara:strand:+ start:143 stop:499 length:357 start_codon:yes stop_codon:yes gene_type:complete